MLIKNARIVTFDDDNKFIENGFLIINDGKIAKLGNMIELTDNEENQEVIDAKGKLLMPGFICTHTHIYSAFARGMDLKGASTSNFIEILQNLWWRLDKKLNHEDIYYSALVTLVQSIKNGVTCLFDHHASPFSIEGSLDVLERAFKDIGTRGTLCYEVSDRDGTEKALEGIKENVRFIRKNQKDEMVKGIFGLHASFTLSNSTLELASSEGCSLGTGFHIHAAEGADDCKHSRRYYGEGVIEHLQNNFILNHKSILAHCIHIKNDEVELLKKCNVVHNPESNMNNAVGYCSAPVLLNKGIIVGLGSDGFSTDPFRAMDCCYILHKHENKDPTIMTPDQVIKLSIKNNSRIASKFFKNAIGVIKTGAWGDVILVDYASPTPLNRENICGHMIFGMSSSMVTDTIVNGKIVMKDRKLINIDEERIFSKSREQAEKLWERF
jgi:putative selenium metabolism protein SsnA